MDEEIQKLESKISNLEKYIENELQKFDAKFSNLEKKIDNSEAKKLSELAEISFKTVLDADIHLDNKASRILNAMAFLTAAASAIFAKAYSPVQTVPELQQVLTEELLPYITVNQLPSKVSTAIQSLQKPQIGLFGIDWALLSFSAYIFLVLLGAALYLAALGPSFNIPDWLRAQGGDNEVKSLIFFDTIAKTDETKWRRYWFGNSPNVLQNDITHNFIYESHLIAKKTKIKVKLMSIGSICFRVALLPLALLIKSLFPYYSEEVSGLVLTFTVAFFAIITFIKPMHF